MILDAQAKEIFGMSVKQLLDMRRDMQVLGLDLSDLTDYLQKDKVQLHAAKCREIKQLQGKLNAVKQHVGELQEKL